MRVEKGESIDLEKEALEFPKPPRSEERTEDLHKVEEVLQYRFKNLELLDVAFTHRSYVRENLIGGKFCNQRLEFLGDGILEGIIKQSVKPPVEAPPSRATLPDTSREKCLRAVTSFSPARLTKRYLGRSSKRSIVRTAFPRAELTDTNVSPDPDSLLRSPVPAETVHEQ